MKVRFPLSLKITLWFLLNLVLLGGAAVGLLVAQGGLSWDSLVIGTPGERLHSLASVVTGEAAAAARGERDAVLQRFSEEYQATFLLVRNRGPRIAGPAMELPSVVRQRIDEGPPALRPHGPMPEDPTPEDRGPRNGEGQRPSGRGRFLVHTSDPAAWWIGFRVPFRDGPGRPGPATLLVQAPSLWRVVVLLNLETWLLVGATVLAMSVLFWLPLVRSITRQIRLLTVATEKIAEGKFETRVPANRADELGRLGESVNAMAGRLDTLVNGQKRFLADIAHELGSPLGRLQVATEILETRAAPDLREQVNDVREEVQQMSELLNELLAFTQAGMRPRDAILAAVPLDPLVANVLAREDQAGRVHPQLKPGLVVLADEPLLNRAVANLVRNALRYAGESGAITVTARAEPDGVVILVEDEGPGVPAGDLQRLGEPFYRPELARTRETGGIGLGLAIVRSAVAACGGTVTLSNRTPRGFRAEIRLKST